MQREKVSPPLDPMHAEIAHGEMTITLGLFGGLNGTQDGIPVEWLREWIRDERIPCGWKSTHSRVRSLALRVKLPFLGVLVCEHSAWMSVSLIWQGAYSALSAAL